MSCPAFTIVTEDGTGRLILVDDHGVGNAIPTAQGFRDLDLRQDYVTGDVGKNPVRLAHEFILSMDYVNQEIRETLLDWKFRRLRVTLGEPALYGPQTVFGYAPTDMTGGGQYDLTGDYEIGAAGDAHLFGIWNDLTRKMEAARVQNQSIITTSEFGPAHRGTRKAMNHAPNPYPESASPGFGAGLMGYKWGDTTGGATRTFNSGGFDNALCPDTVLIQSDGSAGAVQLWSSDYFDSSSGDYGGWVPPAGSAVWVSIWVKGVFPSGSILTVGPTGSEATLDIADLDTSDWTKVTLTAGYQPGAYADFKVVLNCSCSVSEVCNFEIGPTVISVEDDTEPGSSHGGPGDFTAQTNGATGAATVPCYTYGVDFETPAAGTATAIYSTPEQLSLNTNDNNDLRIGMFFLPSSTGAAWDGLVHLQNRGGAWAVRVICATGVSEYFNCDASVLFSPGVHSLSVAWGNGPVRCFVDGKELVPEVGSINFAGGVGPVYFNGLSSGPYTGCALRFHGFNISNGVMSPGEIGGLLGLFKDTVSRNLVDTCRARLYEIVDVPSVPLIQDGFTRWIGDLKLRQIKYTDSNPAWFAEDVY